MILRARAVAVTGVMMQVMAGSVVIAAFGRHGQAAAEIGGHERCDRSVRQSRAHCNAVMRENVEGAAANAVGDHDLDAVFAQPAGEQAPPRQEGLFGFNSQSDFGKFVFKNNIIEREEQKAEAARSRSMNRKPRENSNSERRKVRFSPARPALS